MDVVVDDGLGGIVQVDHFVLSINLQSRDELFRCRRYIT